MLQCWLNMNIGVQSCASERYRLCHEPVSVSGKMNYSMQFRPIEVQQALNRHVEFNLKEWLGLQACLTLTVTCTLRNSIFLTQAFITIWSLFTLRIFGCRNSDIVSLWYFMNIRHELAGHRVNSSAETVIQILNVFELSWWKSVDTIHFKVQVFGGPNIQVSQYVV
jgi:hypothetical protein